MSGCLLTGILHQVSMQILERHCTWCEFEDIDLATDKLLLVYILLLCLPKVLGTFSLTIDFMIV